MDRSTDPIAELEKISSELRGAHARTHWLIAKVYPEASQISQSDQLIERFRHHKFWSGVAFPNCILRAAMRFAWNAAQTGTGDYKTAVFNSAALQDYFHQGLHADDVWNLIRTAGGIGPLHRDQPRALQATQDGNRVIRSPDMNGGHPEGDRAATSRGDPSPKPKTMAPGTIMRSSGQKGSGARRAQRFSRGWCEARLFLEIEPADLDRTLERQRGTSSTLNFVAEGPDSSGFFVFRVTHIFDA